MSVAFDFKPASLDLMNPAVTPDNFNSTVTLGATATALIVFVAVNSNNSTPAELTTCTGLTWNGVAMSQVGSTLLTSDGLNGLSAWRLVNPATGTHTLTATFAGGTIANNSGYYDCVSFSGTALTDVACFPPADVATDTSTPAGSVYPASAFSINTVSGDAVCAVMVDVAHQFLTTTGTLLRTSSSTFRGTYTSAYQLAVGTTTTIQFTGGASGSPGAGIAFRIAAPAGGGVVPLGGAAELFAPKLGPDWRPRGFQPRLAFSRAAGTTFNQTVAVTCTSTVSIAKQIAKSVTVNCASTVALVKSVAKSVAATCTSTVSLVKQAGKSIATTCTSTVALVKSVAKSVAVTCTSSVTISAIRVFLVTISVNCTTTVSAIRKAVSKSIAVTCSGAVTQARSIGKSVAVTCSGAVTYTKQVSHSVAVTCSGAVTYTKQTAKRVAVTCASSVIVSAIRVFLVTISVNCTTTVSAIRKSVGKNVAVTVAGSVTMSRAIAKTVAVTVAGAVTLTKAIAKSVAVTCSSLVSIIASFFSGSGATIRTLNVTIKTGTTPATIETGTITNTVKSGSIVADITE